MRIFQILVLCILVFLAVSSGIAKILLLPQDVELFGKYGFTTPLLIAFGSVQLVGGLMMVFVKTRLVSAALVAVTFAISAIVLIMERNIPFTIATLIALTLLGWTIWQMIANQGGTFPNENGGK